MMSQVNMIDPSEFFFVEKIISNVEKIPNGMLEYDEFTFEITIRNTSESVESRIL